MKLILYSPGIWVIHSRRTYSQYDRNAKQTNDNLWKHIRSAGRPHWHFCNSHANTYLFLGVISEILIVLQWLDSHIFGGVLPFRDRRQLLALPFGDWWGALLRWQQQLLKTLLKRLHMFYHNHWGWWRGLVWEVGVSPTEESPWLRATGAGVKLLCPLPCPGWRRNSGQLISFQEF